MKRFSKILVAVLALCLLVGALALAISANTGVEGKFVVQGTGYETWEDAVAAANNTHTIYINENWELEKGITLSGETTNVKVNLNGKTVSFVGSDSVAFSVQSGAKFAITGEGVLNSVSGLISAQGASTVNFDATGSGIVINHDKNGESIQFHTFRIHDRSILNVSGAITVNATNGARYVFNLKEGNETSAAAQFNLNRAKINVPRVTGTDAGVGGRSQVIILGVGVNATITDSEIDARNSNMIVAEVTGEDRSNTTYKDANSPYKWLEGAAAKVDIPDGNITLTAKNSTFLSCYETKVSSAAMGSIMHVSSRLRASFDKCNFYGDHRAVTSSTQNATGQYVKSHQLLFTDCNFAQAPKNSGSAGAQNVEEFFIYGVNYKIIGGTYSYYSGGIANGSSYYLELTDAEGNPTGEWCGGYIDNVLLSSDFTIFDGINTNASGDPYYIDSGWRESSYTVPNSKKADTITLIVDGVSRTFVCGYFSDTDIYNAYLSTDVPAVPAPAWRDYLHGCSDGSGITATDDYKAVDGKGTGTWHMSPMGAGHLTGTVSSVLGTNKNGVPNGYVKSTDVQTGSSNFHSFSCPVGSDGSIVTTDAMIFEFDLATENQFHETTMTFQGRSRFPRFDVNGTYLGATNSSLADGAMDYGPGTSIEISKTNVISYGNGTGAGSYTLPTNGDWTRITAIMDFESTGVVEEIEIDAYTKSGTTYTLVEGQKAKVNAIKLTKYNVYMYVNGEYCATYTYDVSSIGYGGYIPVGYEGNFYVDGLRVFLDNSSAAETNCFDNVRVSKYTHAQNVDLGYLDENGAPKASIKGLEHFLVMPDNMEPAPYAIVDGVEYDTEAEALAAIKNGSVVELSKNLESAIKADAAFKLYTNGFSFPGFVSATHTPVDYVGSFGYIELVPASELYTVNYTFNGVTKTQTVAKGTVIPEMDTDFPSIVDGNTAAVVVGWTLPVNIPTDYNTAGNVINAIAVKEDREIVILVGNTVYENLADAVAGAKGETIVLCKDITVDALEGAVATTYKTISGGTAVKDSGVGVNINDGSKVTIDFNGHKVTQNFEGVLFNVTKGTLNLTGSATFENVRTFARATGVDSKYNVIAKDSGFVVKTTADGFTTFLIEGSADASVSGAVTVELAAGDTSIFKMTGGDTITIDKATIIASEPTSFTKYNRFFTMGDYNHIVINDSTLKMVGGSMFDLCAASEAGMNIDSYLYKDENGQYLYPDESKLVDGKVNFSIGELKSTIKATNSSITTTRGEYVGSGNVQESHCLFYTNKAGISLKVDFVNCDLVSNSRVFRLGTRPQYGGVAFSPAQLTFIDCDYNSDGKTQSSSMLLYQNCNIRWIGGTLKNYSTLVGCASYPFEFQDGFAGIHFYNTNIVGETSTGTQPAFNWNLKPADAWTRYYRGCKGAAIVDGAVYATEAEALAAIKDSSTIELLSNFEAKTLPLALACTIDNHGGYFKTPAIVSSTHKALIGANGNINVSAASADEIFTINYAFGGKTATQTAALGTAIVAPKEIDDRFVDSDSKKVVVLKGWTLVDGEDVVVVTGNANAIAKIESADPVIVYWTTADGETVLDTDYYLPGEHTTLPEFDGEDIKPDHTADYYGIGRTGWAGIENVNLAAAGENTVKAVMGKIAPDTFPGLKYNFTLYAFHVLNFYIPQNIEGVEFVGVSTVKDGSAAFTAMGEGTIENKPYNRYSYILGAADTGLKNYYIVYNVDGVKLSFEVQNIGVPSYSVQVMKDYENKNEAKDVAAKTLIVNMANYADKVLTVTNGDKTTPGAMAYTYILNNYGAQYLTRYNELTNDKFLKDGEIYKADGVADLNWILYHDGDASNDDEANAEALSFIKGISFVFDTYEPRFIMEYSDAAIAVGLQKPDKSDGSTGAHAAGLHAYTGFGEGAQAYSKQWAQDASGKVYNKSDDVWYTGVKNAETGEFEGINHCDSVKYDYFFAGSNYGALLNNTYWNVHKLADMSGKFTIRLEIEANDNTSATTGDRTVGYVYYNLAAYINSMMDAEGEAEANADFIAAAKALYAYSEAAAAYKAQ